MRIRHFLLRSASPERTLCPESCPGPFLTQQQPKEQPANKQGKSKGRTEVKVTNMEHKKRGQNKREMLDQLMLGRNGLVGSINRTIRGEVEGTTQVGP